MSGHLTNYWLEGGRFLVALPSFFIPILKGEPAVMSMYFAKDLSALWSQEKLSLGQAIGQILQNLLAILNRL